MTQDTEQELLRLIEDVRHKQDTQQLSPWMRVFEAATKAVTIAGVVGAAIWATKLRAEVTRQLESHDDRLRAIERAIRETGEQRWSYTDMAFWVLRANDRLELHHERMATELGVEVPGVMLPEPMQGDGER